MPGLTRRHTPGQRFAPELRTTAETRSVGTSPFVHIDAGKVPQPDSAAGKAPSRPVPLFSHHKSHNDTDDSPLPPPTHSFGTTGHSGSLGTWDAALPPRSMKVDCGLCAPWGCDAKSSGRQHRNRIIVEPKVKGALDEKDKVDEAAPVASRAYFSSPSWDDSRMSDRDRQVGRER
jgi:hypothetical protein